jgi:hypothetical protein
MTNNRLQMTNLAAEDAQSVICHLSLGPREAPRSLAGLDDDEGLLAVAVENHHHWTIGI